MSPESIEKSEEERESEEEPKYSAWSWPTDDVGWLFVDDRFADKVRRGMIWSRDFCEDDVVKIMSCRGAALLQRVVC